MTMTEIKPKGSSKATSIKFSQVTLMYVQLKKARPIYAQKDFPASQQNMFEYSVDIVVDEDTSDEWDALFPKQSAKKMLKKDFMKAYKIEKDEDFPKGLDSKAKKYYVVKIKQNTHYTDVKTKEVKALGKELRPRLVYLNPEGKKVDGTLTMEVGNGSIGDVLVSINTNKTYGDSGKLKAVLVTDLVEYSGGGSSKAELDDFFGDDVELAELPDEPTVSANGTQADDDSDVPNDLPEDDEAPFDLEEEDY